MKLVWKELVYGKKKYTANLDGARGRQVVEIIRLEVKNTIRPRSWPPTTSGYWIWLTGSTVWETAS